MTFKSFDNNMTSLNILKHEHYNTNHCMIRKINGLEVK